MRNSTFLITGIALAMTIPATAETMSPLKMMADAKAHVFTKESGVKDDNGQAARRQQSKVNGQKGAALMRMSEMAKKMKPGTTKTFAWDRGSWMPEDVYTYTYDTSGNVTLEDVLDAEGDYSRTVSEYNENGMVTLRDVMTSNDGVNFSGYKKSTFEYDPILTNVITQRTESVFLNGEWRPETNNYKRIITRDENGNITHVVIAVLFLGEYDPTQRLTVTYGEDGKADTITEEILGYDGREYYWEQSTRISEIVWERTDGQIYTTEDLFFGNNRIGSARYEDPDGIDMNVTVEYAEDSEAYTAHMTMTMDGMSVTATMEYTPLENDGYIAVGTTYFMGQALYSNREEYRYDDWGLMTLSYTSETEEGMTYGDVVTGDVEYDQEGKPLTYTISERYFDEEFGEDDEEYVIRAEYSNYIDVTEGSGVEAIDPEEAGRYYDINGFRVASPRKGQMVIKDKRLIIKD